MGPIISAMRRNKFGALLISAQLAVTLAFVVNAFTLLDQRISWNARPSGVDEQNLFVVDVDSLSRRDDTAAARAEADLAALRTLPAVVDTYVTNDYPFEGGGWANSVNIVPNQRISTASTSYYFADTHTLKTLGLNLIAGRNFTADEVVTLTRNATESQHAGSLIVSKALAQALYPSGNALGQSIYVEDDVHPARIIGIVERLQGPYPDATGEKSSFAENTTLAPYRDLTGRGRYMVRTDPAHLGELMKRAEQKLLEMDGDRVVRAISLVHAREEAHRGNHGLVVLLICICAALLTVTGFGIIGLTSYWVSQRRQQIGIRRALGATRCDIVHYFQTENLMIAGAGAVGGIVFSAGLNLWMVRSFEMTRIDNRWAIGSALVIILLGQISVFWPALRASWIPPALATRGG
jgi:putative ABC transport system permease protein